MTLLKLWIRIKNIKQNNFYKLPNNIHTASAKLSLWWTLIKHTSDFLHKSLYQFCFLYYEKDRQNNFFNYWMTVWINKFLYLSHAPIYICGLKEAIYIYIADIHIAGIYIRSVKYHDKGKLSKKILSRPVSLQGLFEVICIKIYQSFSLFFRYKLKYVLLKWPTNMRGLPGYNHLCLPGT